MQCDSSASETRPRCHLHFTKFDVASNKAKEDFFISKYKYHCDILDSKINDEINDAMEVLRGASANASTSFFYSSPAYQETAFEKLRDRHICLAKLKEEGKALQALLFVLREGVNRFLDAPDVDERDERVKNYIDKLVSLKSMA